MTQYTFTGKVHSNVQISRESLQLQSGLAEELLVPPQIQLYSTLLGYSTTVCVVESLGTSLKQQQQLHFTMAIQVTTMWKETIVCPCTHMQTQLTMLFSRIPPG